jgi:hypothetical protein
MTPNPTGSPERHRTFKPGWSKVSFDGLSRLNRRLPVLIALTWIVLYVPRPFELGLYHDDWSVFAAPAHATAPFSLARLHWFLGFDTAFGPRPVGGLVAFLASSLCGASAFRFQCCSSLLVLLAALSLRSWLNLLLGVFPAFRVLAGDLATVFWMSMPWMLGVTAWPIVAQLLVAQILFTEAARMLLRRQQLTSGLAAQFTIALLGSGLTYEAFYFAIFPLIAFYTIYRRGLMRNARQVAWVIALSCIAQGLPIVYNRYCASINSGAAKKFSPGWGRLFLNNMRGLPRALVVSLGEYHHLWVELVAVLAIGSALGLLWPGLVKKVTWRYRGHVLGIVTLAGVILLASDVIYSLARYGFSSIGTDSRVLFSPSLSFTLVFFAACSCWVVGSARYWKALGALSASAVITVTALAQRERVAEWAHVWQEERRILSVAPAEQIGSIPKDSAVLYLGPTYFKGIVIFGAEWDLTGAVFTQNPHTKGHPYDARPAIFPFVDGYRAAWDGATLLWELPGFWQQKVPAAQLYLWRLGKPTLEPASPGFTLPLPASATFVGVDTATQGTWKSSYGVDGYDIANDAPKYPLYAETVLRQQKVEIWAVATDDVRAPQMASGKGRMARTWFSPSAFTIDINFNDGSVHRVALYCLDWEAHEEPETIDVVDAASGRILDSRAISNFANGQYVIWNLSGNVRIRVTRLGGSNAVVSGVFFDSPSQVPNRIVKADGRSS